MAGPDLDEYLKKGMYGEKEIKPDERRKFLGTIRERVIIVLTQPQMREKGIYTEVEDAIKSYPDAKIFLNGHLDYETISKYTKIINGYDRDYTIVTNKSYNSKYGLVIAAEYAIEKTVITVTKQKQAAKPKPKKGLLTKINKLFRRK